MTHKKFTVLFLKPIDDHNFPCYPIFTHGRGTADGGKLGSTFRAAPCRASAGERWGNEVELFLSTFVNKVDRKGRVSVPATFRAAVADQSFPGIVVFPSFRHDALDGSGIKRMEEMSDRLDA